MTDQYAGTPTSMAGAYVLLEHLQKDNEALVEKVQEALTQRDNLVDLTIEVGRLGAYLKDVLAERDDAERECGELREQLDSARCRLQELEPMTSPLATSSGSTCTCRCGSSSSGWGFCDA
jgi:phage shock protein A